MLPVAESSRLTIERASPNIVLPGDRGRVPGSGCPVELCGRLLFPPGLCVWANAAGVHGVQLCVAVAGKRVRFVCVSVIVCLW
jgi:hypothetical protein